MEQSVQLDLFTKRTEEMRQILIRKGHDYATKDVLNNFKRTALISKLLNIDNKTPQGKCLDLIVLKLDRLCNLLFSGKAPKNESVDDTLLDFQNYIFLLNCILNDVQNLPGGHSQSRPQEVTDFSESEDFN